MTQPKGKSGGKAKTSASKSKSAGASKAGASKSGKAHAKATKKTAPEPTEVEVATAAPADAPAPSPAPTPSVRLDDEIEVTAKPPKKKAAPPEYVTQFDGKWTPELEDAVIEHMTGYLETEGEEEEGPPQLSLLQTMTPEKIQEFILGKRALGDLFGITIQEAYSIAKFGHNYLEGGKFAEAEAIFKGLVTLIPRDAYFHTCLGATYQRWGRKQDAVEEYTAAILIEPGDLDALVNRGEIRLLAGQIADGLEDLQSAIAVADRAGRTSPTLNRARALAAMVALAMKEKLEAPAP
ncbi:MAG: hypothetical protein HYV07_05830 [Deltaproteobacteria bacterium]|nr:hypothetical protein [Deltaproteobacteria bacterium]